MKILTFWIVNKKPLPVLRTPKAAKMIQTIETADHIALSLYHIGRGKCKGGMIMASYRKLTTKDGRPFYEISVSRGRGKSRLTRRWYPPDGWSRKAIERELAAVAAEFERQSDAGEIITRAEQREREAQAAAEAAKILTLRQYGERVFMPSKAVTMSENGRSNYQSYLLLGRFKLPTSSLPKAQEKTKYFKDGVQSNLI